MDRTIYAMNMNNLWVFIFFTFIQIGFSQKNENVVFGRVTDGISPIENVIIEVADTSSNTSTDENGYYKIKASPLDILVFSYMGRRDQEIVVEDVTSRLNIVMKMKIEKLEEVNVTKKIDPRNQDYLRLRLRIGTVRGTIGQPSEKAIFLRGRSSISNPRPAIYDVDGVVMTEPPLYLIIQNIDRVAVMPGLLGVTRYGPLAAGGVVVISTKGSNVVKEPGTNKLYDFAKLRDNIYQDDALDQEGVLKNSPSYIKDLYESTNLTEAKKHYEHYAKTFGTDPYFILDSYLFFSAKGSVNYAAELLQENIGLFKNAVQLKALAYALEVTDKPDMANKFYKEIFWLRPSYAQSYRDLANNYLATGNYKRVAHLHVRYLHLINEGFFPNDSRGINAIVKGEFKNLLKLHKNDISENSGLVFPDMNISREEGTRILFEWNDSEAEFELQFVNPEKHYFTWEHTNISNPDRIRDEKIRGYSSEEFFIYEDIPGNWQINVTYKGNKKLTSTYLKLTVYTNYNKRSQKSFSKLYKLRLKNVNQQLLDFSEVMRLP